MPLRLCHLRYMRTLYRQMIQSMAVYGPQGWDGIFWCILKAELNDIVYELYRVAQSILCSVLYNAPHGLRTDVNYV